MDRQSDQDRNHAIPIWQYPGVWTVLRDVLLGLILFGLILLFLSLGLIEGFLPAQGLYDNFFLKDWPVTLLALMVGIYALRRSRSHILLAGLLADTRRDLDAYKNRYYKIFDNIRDIYCEIRFDGTVVEVSPAIVNFTGYSREEFIGQKIHRFYKDPSQKDIMVRQLLACGELRDFELDFCTRWGSVYTGSLNCILESDQHGNPVRIYGTMRDVTQWRKAARLLEESEQKYRGIFENIQDVYYETDLDGKLLEISPAIERASLFQRDELIGNLFFSYCQNPEEVRSGLFRQVKEQGLIKDVELQLKDRDGRIREFSVNAEQVHDEDGHPLRIIGSMRDISDRKRVEDALRRSRDELEERVAERTEELLRTNQKLLREIEDRKRVEAELLKREETFRALTENSTDIIIRFANDLTLVFANSAVNRISGLVPREIRGKGLHEVQFEEGLCQLMGKQLPLVFEGGVARDFTFTCPNPQGGRVYDWRLIPEWSSEGTVASVLCTGRDITRLKSAENRIKILTQELIRAQENERQKIARDLHDHIAQDLATLKIMSQNLFDTWEDVPHTLRVKADILNRTLGNSIQAVRDLAYDLRPPTLDALGLVRTLFVYCEDVSSKYGIVVDFSSAGLDALDLNFDTEINLYRLLQEALSNVRKHARAHRVTVRLVASHPHIILRIEDDGMGFLPDERMGEAAREKRMGLRSMEERVALLGGKMKIQSSPGAGTRIHILVAMRLKEGQELLSLPDSAAGDNKEYG
ncbi:PAS domain S-box protein [Desulfobotulus sp. H1]|uniref:PAS domain S-box protein n=1 Tax=Desulfobotulus pelophilus TaxID=2823377 RepID=A0ABT3NCX4_9BACT|nr:PAS domain-containing sensor histidine kinase [Desulfobotulus pelophilus]MCW7755315.1 PAS domain S-box protein [Desulfobotulus pelophilus]